MTRRSPVSMMTESKNRIFVAVYLQEEYDGTMRDKLGLSFYRWALWIEPKGAKEDTRSHCFDVVHDYYPDTWQFRYDDSAQAIRSTGLLLRVMVGKLPRGVSVSPDLLQLLYEIPLPNPASEYIEDSVSWTAEALLVLQEHGCIDNLNVANLMQDVAIAADEVRKETFRIGGCKLNAVENRKFP